MSLLYCGWRGLEDIDSPSPVSGASVPLHAICSLHTCGRLSLDHHGLLYTAADFQQDELGGLFKSSPRTGPGSLLPHSVD